MLPIQSVAHAAPASACPAAAPDSASAVAAARACGSRVEVLAGRTEDVQVFANPNGTTTVEQSVVPARVHRPDGSWADVDATLSARGNSWVPKASTVDVGFSNGGAGPFATYQVAGQTLTLTWPLGSLPAPVASGSSVEYSNVLPGINLWVSVTSTGFRPVVEVTNATAAANPALRALTYTVGGTVRGVPTADGRIRFTDSAGRTVAQTDAATMWDSTSSAVGIDTTTVGETPADLRSTASDAGDFARTGPVGVTTRGADLTVHPDRDLLAGPATVYPVFIDPTISPSQSKWAYADSCNTSNYTDYARVGLDPSDGCRYRSFFTMPVSQSGLTWMGKNVLSAEFDIELYHSYSCTSTWTWVYNSGAITASPRMSWTSVPLPGDGGVAAEAHANKAGGCSDSPQPDVLMKFSGSAMLSRVQYASTRNWSTYTVGLCACNPQGQYEDSQDRWKKFYIDSRAKLIVSYDTTPGVPANLSTSGASCGSSIGITSPTLKAQAVDADTGDTLSGTFHWQQLPSGTVNSVSFSGVPANNYVTTTLSLGGSSDGHQYQWQIQTEDSKGFSSAWSSWCSFTVDVAAPPEPTVAPSGTPLYVACDPSLIGSCTAAGGPGVPGSFKFGPNGAGNVVSFSYGWTSPPTKTVTVTAGSSITITATPPHFGLNTLYASDFNGSKSSPIVPYQFLVTAPSAPLADWPLDSINGHNLTDQVSGSALTTTSGASWTPDVRFIGANALTFDGVSGAATSTVSGFDTSKSFSVGAWVRPSTIASHNMTAIGQDGVDAGGFYLGTRYLGSPSVPHWSFMMKDTTASTSSSIYVAATATLGAADVGKWVHLTGVYDAGEKTISLYVNGVLASTTARTATPWTASGPLSIGRGFYNAAQTDWWSGEVADVRVWNRAITTDDLWGTDEDVDNGVPAVSGVLSPMEVGSWDFADVPGCGCGGPTIDSAYFGRGLFLDNGWANATPTSAFVLDSHNGNGALSTDGVAGFGSTTDPSDGSPVPVLRTDQSLTISVWARVNQLNGVEQAVVQQGLADHSAIKLAVGSSNKWNFAVTDPDGSGGYVWLTAVSDQLAVAGQWTHLVGVFDAGAGAVTLYVDGVRQSGTASGASGWYDPASYFHLGVGTASSYFGGAIDQVELFQGTLSDRQITNLYQSDHL